MKTSFLDRRSFLAYSALLTGNVVAARGAARFRSAKPRPLDPVYHPIADQLPARPIEDPLPWKEIADAFDAYIMQPANKVLLQRPDGNPGFVSALEGKSDGGLTTFGPVLLGRVLRDDDVGSLIPSLEGYFSQEYGLFLDGVGANLCEYWYLMNIHALAAGIVKAALPDQPRWTGMLRRSLDRLMAMAQQIQYDFNAQGYNFKEHRAFTVKDIYRQPDAIAGYSYVMLFGYNFFGDAKFLQEAQTAMARYLAFTSNPWYEIPSGAMGALAAARLSTGNTNNTTVDLHKALSFVLDPSVGLMRTGTWGGKEVNGLMAGFSTEPPDQAYSMESMVVLPYLLPVLRYRPEYAHDIARYALSTLANLRYFYPAYLPKANQSRPELPSAFPYERLDKTLKGQSPYAAGDYDSHRSVYGGAYAMWLGAIVQPPADADKQILQIDIARTDFLAHRSYPTYLVYNPYPSKRTVALSLHGQSVDLYDLAMHRMVAQNVAHTAPLTVEPGQAKVLAAIPVGATRSTKAGVLCFNDVEVDYSAR